MAGSQLSGQGLPKQRQLPLVVVWKLSPGDTVDDRTRICDNDSNLVPSIANHKIGVKRVAERVLDGVGTRAIRVHMVGASFYTRRNTAVQAGYSTDGHFPVSIEAVNVDTGERAETDNG